MEDFITAWKGRDFPALIALYATTAIHITSSHGLARGPKEILSVFMTAAAEPAFDGEASLERNDFRNGPGWASAKYVWRVQRLDGEIMGTASLTFARGVDNTLEIIYDEIFEDGTEMRPEVI